MQIQNIKDIFQLIISSQLQEKLFPLKIIFILISVLFIFWIIYFLAKSEFLSEAYLGNVRNLFVFKNLGQKKLVKRWQKIKKRLDKGASAAQWKLSLLEGSKMLDEVLQKTGYGPGTFDERLKKLTEDDVSNRDQLFEAHQVCQDIIRDPDYRLSKEKAQELIDIFKKALKDLQVF